MDDRAVSVAITHALAIAITTVLLSGLFVASDTLLESQENRVGQDQVDEIGGDVATYLHSFDRLNKTGTGVNATAEPKYADQIVNTYSYQIRLENESDTARIIVEPNRLGRESVYELELDTKVEPSQARGGTIQINLCSPPSSGKQTYIILGECES
jgi:hypothetical protein